MIYDDICIFLNDFAQNFLDIPETELFEVFQHHRRGMVRWFERQRKNKEYGKFNRVLQEVHKQRHGHEHKHITRV